MAGRWLPTLGLPALGLPMLRLGVLGLAVTLGGCTTFRPVPQVSPLPSDVAFAWPSVLDQAVDDTGQVDFRGLQAVHGALDIAVAAVAATDLQALPDRRAQLAFLINANNILWVYDVVRSGIPDRLGAVGRADLMRLTQFDVAGQPRSLVGLWRDVITPLASGPGGDWRVPLALYCPAVSCPRLARTPYTAEGLDAQLDAAARRFIGDPANVVVDPAAPVVRVNALLAHTPGLRATLEQYGAAAPKGYRIEAMAFDWTVPAP